MCPLCAVRSFSQVLSKGEETVFLKFVDGERIRLEKMGVLTKEELYWLVNHCLPTEPSRAYTFFFAGIAL